MTQATLSCNKYGYAHQGQNGPSQAIDIHDIFISKSMVRVLLSYLGTFLFLANIWYLLLVQEKLCIRSILGTFMGVFFAKSLQYKPIKQESVVIMSTFGVQLETHFWSGRVARRFIPIGKILRPVLNECVTPVTCYWSLALMLRGEEELMLVFEELRPPVTMLVSVWKALRAATDCREAS